MIFFAAFMFDAAATGANAALYVSYHHSYSIGSAVFCGLCSLYQLVFIHGR